MSKRLDFGPIPEGEPLTQEEVNALPVGTRVIIIWAGGNGPHRYTILRDKRGDVRASNVYRDRLNNCGTHPFANVRVWKEHDAKTGNVTSGPAREGEGT
jgi:hypothetical protein